MECKICQNKENNKIFRAKEMMFGYRDEFDYLECSNCGCVQITDIPNDISKYYPESYYSFNFKRKKTSLIRKFFENYFLNKQINGEEINNKFIKKKFRKYYIQDFFIKTLCKRVNKADKIIDIGCGSGRSVYLMKNAGYDICGYDPYIEKTINYHNKAVIYKNIDDIKDNKFSVIVMTHSFEHMDNPQEMFNMINDKLLAKNQKAIFILSIPLANYAWKKYRSNWVQLDAPRHFFLHTEESIKILAENAGMEIKDIIYNSDGFQFWGSEQYIKDIPLFSGQSYAVNKNNSMFSEVVINDYEKRADTLNKEKQGDQATFVIERSFK